MTFRIHYADGSTYESPLPWADAPDTGVQAVVIWDRELFPETWTGLDAYWSDGILFGGFLDMPPFEEVAMIEQQEGRLKRGSLIADELYAQIQKEATLNADHPPRT